MKLLLQTQNFNIKLKPRFFTNRQLNALTKCRNDFLREKLIDQTISLEIILY